MRIVCSFVALFLTTALAAAEPVKPLSGRVVDENGRPLAGASVIVAGGEEDSVLASIVTGADGRFRFDGQLREKRTTIVATKDGKCLDWDGSFRTSAAEPVLRLGPAAAIEGALVDDAGHPVAAASVRTSLRVESPTERDLHYRSAGGAITVKTDAQGRFRLANLPAAAFVQFDISAPGYAWSCAAGPFAPARKGFALCCRRKAGWRGLSSRKARAARCPVYAWRMLGAVTGEPHSSKRKPTRMGDSESPAWARIATTSRSSAGTCRRPLPSATAPSSGRNCPSGITSQQEIHVEAGKAAASVKIEAVKGGTADLYSPIAPPASPSHRPRCCMLLRRRIGVPATLASHRRMAWRNCTWRRASTLSPK